MHRIDVCVSSPLIQYMCKSVQSSFDNCSINTVYSCTLKLKWLGKGLLSLTKYGPIWRTAVVLVYNASSHKTAIVREYLKQEKVVELPHPCDFFLFPRLKKHLAGRKYQTRKNLGSAIFQCLNSIPQKDYGNSFENWIKRLKKTETLCITWRRVFWKIEIKILALFAKRFWKLTQLHSYLNTHRISNYSR